MEILFDTHTLIWAVLQPVHLSQTAAKLIYDRANQPIVSAVSAWEIATKVRLGKLKGVEAFEASFVEAVTRADYKVLPIGVETALRAARFPSAHRDPFDRLLAAQAMDLNIPILSTDAKLDEFGVQRIW